MGDSKRPEIDAGHLASTTRLPHFNLRAQLRITKDLIRGIAQQLDRVRISFSTFSLTHVLHVLLVLACLIKSTSTVLQEGFRMPLGRVPPFLPVAYCKQQGRPCGQGSTSATIVSDGAPRSPSSQFQCRPLPHVSTCPSTLFLCAPEYLAAYSSPRVLGREGFLNIPASPMH